MTPEVCDIYDKNFKPTGRTGLRGEPLNDGEYLMAVFILVQNNDKKFLITKRSEHKKAPGMWEFHGGCAIAGDTSLSAAIRESKEEIGFDLIPEKGSVLTRVKYDDFFADVWLFKQEFDLDNLVLQEDEVSEARAVTLAEIRRLADNDEFLPCDKFIHLLDEYA